MNKKKIGVAVITVPVLAAGTVALASSYRAGTDFKPSDTEQELQVNQVVFDKDENGTGHEKKKDGDESRLFKKNEEKENGEATQLKDQADYLFENQQMHTESVGIVDDNNKEKTSSDTADTKSQDEKQPDKVYNLTKDESKADTSLNNNNAATNGTGNGSGGPSSEKETTTTTTTTTKKPSKNNSNKNNTGNKDDSSNSGNNGSNNNGGNGNTNNGNNNGNTNNGNNGSNSDNNNGNNNSTSRPADTAKDPESVKKDPSNSFGTDKPYTDGITPGLDADETGDTTSVVIMQSTESSGNGLYEGQTVERTAIYNALDTWVYGKDGNRYLWRSDALDRYVRIDAVSFDGSKSWNTTFPLTLPEDLEEGQMLIKVSYRLSTKDNEWTERQVKYNLYQNRIFVLAKQLQEDNQVIGAEDILNLEQHPEIGSKLNLLMCQWYAFGNEELTELFPGWTENNEIVPWFYPVTKGRHILEPADSIPLDSGYTVKMTPQWMTEDLKIDYFGKLCYLQTLTDFNEGVLTGGLLNRTLSVPKYIQSVDLSDDMDQDVEYLEIPDTVLYYDETTTGVRVEKGYKVNENNLNYSSTQDGILADKAKTEYLGVPCELESLTVPGTVNRVVLTENNNLSTLKLEAQIYDELPEITYRDLKDCKTILKDDLLLSFIENNYRALSVGKGNTVASEENPDTTYTVKNEGIVSNQGELRKVLKTGRHNFRLPSDVTTIQSGAFEEVSGLTTVILPQAGDKITLEKDCFAGSDVTTIRCYSEEQYQSVKEQLDASGAADDITVEIIGKSVEGIGYIRSETEDTESVTVIDVPDSITSFEGVLTTKEGEALDITAIGDNAFENCNSLEWVNLPESVKSIGYQAFRNCSSLQGLFISSTDNIYIGNLSVDGCDSLRFIGSNAPNAEMQDGYDPVVSDAQGNMFFYVPTGAEGYGGNSLYFLEESGVYGYSMVDIGDGCYMLYGLDAEGNPWIGLRSGSNVADQVTLPDTTVELFTGALEGTHAPSGSYTVNWDDLSSLWVLDNNAFRESDIGGTVTLLGMPEWFGSYYIGEYSFYGCTKIQSVQIPQENFNIYDGAFGNCSSLKSVVIDGSSYSSIFTGVFTGCDELSDITFGCSYPLTLTSYANSEFRFNYDWTQDEAAQKLRIHVPEGSEMEYIKAWRYLFCGYVDYWDQTAYMAMWETIESENIDWTTGTLPSDETVMNLLESKLLNMENNIRMMLGVETVQEPTDMYHYRFDSNAWTLTLLRVPSNLTELDLGMVWNMGFPFNMDITYIDSNAFIKSSHLQQLDIPYSLAGIKENAFAGIDSDKLVLNFSGMTPPELMRTDETQPFSFGIEDARIEIHVPEGCEGDYINAWKYALAGSEDEEKVFQAENRLRVMMGLEPLEEPDKEKDDANGISDGETKSAEEDIEENAGDTSDEAISDEEIIVEEPEDDSEDTPDQEETGNSEDIENTEETENTETEDTEKTEESAFTEQNAESADVSVESEEETQG